MNLQFRILVFQLLDRLRKLLQLILVISQLKLVLQLLILALELLQSLLEFSELCEVFLLGISQGQVQSAVLGFQSIDLNLKLLILLPEVTQLLNFVEIGCLFGLIIGTERLKLFGLRFDSKLQSPFLPLERRNFLFTTSLRSQP